MVFKKLFSDEKGVTPVVGVMLMVVVTVILAAAVSSYASSMKSQDVAPQATLKASASYADNAIRLEHLGGDILTKSQISIEVAQDTTSGYFNMSNMSMTPNAAYLRPGDVATLSFLDGAYGAQFTGDDIKMSVGQGTPFKLTIIDKNSGQTVYSTTVVTSLMRVLITSLH